MASVPWGFSQVEIAGLVPEPNADVDGFIIQWDRYSGTEPTMHLILPSAAVPSSSNGPQPKHWQVELTLAFEDAAGLAVLQSGHGSDTRFFFRPVGPRREAAVAGAGRYPQLHAALTATPAHNELSFDRVC